MAINFKRLEDSPERQALAKIMSDVYLAYYLLPYRYRESCAKRANRVANSLGQIAGMTVIVPSNYEHDYYNRCGEYVFRNCMGEDWPNDNPNDTDTDSLFFKTAAFLTEHGYLPVDDPVSGDIVVYAEDLVINGTHFGIYEGDGVVVSKFERGPVLRHPLDRIPSDFGNLYYFVRKTHDTEPLYDMGLLVGNAALAGASL